MTSSHSPGALGFYGFRNREDHSYDELAFADSRSVRVPRVWDLLRRAGKRRDRARRAADVPAEPRQRRARLCFLTPDTRTSKYTYPPELKDEIERLVGHYMVDVENFRTDDKDRLLAEIEEMTEKHFRLAEHLLETRPWDMFFMVEMGVDRIHHGFWRYTDHGHRLFEPGNPYEHAMLEYYKRLDTKIASLLRFADDDTAVLVVSDHGAKEDGRRDLRQRVAAPRGLPRAEGGARRADPPHDRHDRLVEDDGVGGRRLLLPALPQRRRPRAGGHRPRRRLRARARRDQGEARGARR